LSWGRALDPFRGLSTRQLLLPARYVKKEKKERMGALKSPWRTAYRTSIKIISIKCLVFEKMAFCVRILATERRMDRWTNIWTAPMH